MVLLLLPGPSAQAVEVAYDIEFFERTPGIFPAADRRHRRAQIGNQQNIARRGLSRSVQIDENFAVAHRQYDCNAVAISRQCPADGLIGPAFKIALPSDDDCRVTTLGKTL